MKELRAAVIAAVILSTLSSVVFAQGRTRSRLGVLTVGTELAAVARGQDGDASPRRAGYGRWWDAALRCVACVAMAVVLILAGLLFFEDHFVFRPSRKPVESWEPPGLGVEGCVFRTRDGLRLHGWWHPGLGAEGLSDRAVLLWCHGNAGNMTHRAGKLRMLAERGLAVMLFDYRGYGKSEGSPSEHGLYLDAEAAYRYLTEERKVPPARIICFGCSLGSAVALHLALVRKTAGLIMDGALENVAAVVRHKVRVLPLSHFVRNRFDNAARVKKLKVPLLVVHGEHDNVVPVEQGRAVFKAAPEPKQFYLVRGGGHDDAPEVGGQEYYETLSQFCHQCVQRAQGSSS